MKDILSEALKKKKEDMGKVHIDILVDGVHNGEKEEKENEELGMAPETKGSSTGGVPRLEDDLHEKAEMAGIKVPEDGEGDEHEEKEAEGEPVAEALLAGEREYPAKGMSGLRDKVKNNIRNMKK